MLDEAQARAAQRYMPPTINNTSKDPTTDSLRDCRDAVELLAPSIHFVPRITNDTDADDLIASLLSVGYEMDVIDTALAAYRAEGGQLLVGHVDDELLTSLLVKASRCRDTVRKMLKQPLPLSVTKMSTTTRSRRKKKNSKQRRHKKRPKGSESKASSNEDDDDESIEPESEHKAKDGKEAQDF